MENISLFIIPMFIFFRMTAFFASMKFMYPTGTPNMFKLFLPLSLTFMVSLGGSHTINIVQEVDNLGLLISFIVNETAIGLVFGYITSICLNVVKMAGSLIDIQMGLSMASTYDPNSKTQSTFIENFMYWMTLLIFVSLDGHHTLIKGILKSFELFPIGQSIFSNESTVPYIINVFVEYFTIGFKISIPIVFSLLLTELILGLISRSVPSFNVMLIGMPTKVLVGLLLFSIAIPFLSKEVVTLLSTIPNMYEGLFNLF